MTVSVDDAANSKFVEKKTNQDSIRTEELITSKEVSGMFHQEVIDLGGNH